MTDGQPISGSTAPHTRRLRRVHDATQAPGAPPRADSHAGRPPPGLQPRLCLAHSQAPWLAAPSQSCTRPLCSAGRLRPASSTHHQFAVRITQSDAIGSATQMPANH